MLKNSILIISAENKKSYDCIQVNNESDRFIFFDDYEYATAYLLACEKENLPKIILIDQNRLIIQKFKDLCNEFSLDLKDISVINSRGEKIILIQEESNLDPKPETHLN